MVCHKCKCPHTIAPNYNQVNTSSESLGTPQDSHLCTIRRSSVLLSFYLPFYVLYLIGGAFVFNVLEKDAESELRQSIRGNLSLFKENHQCITGDELEVFMEKVIHARASGVSALKNATGESIWSFGQSLFFVSTVVTTIGYGSTHPITEGGKIFCIGYAILGIPLTFILLTALVERLVVPVAWIQGRLYSILKDSSDALNTKVLSLLILGTVLVLLFLVFPAVIFSSIEPGWEFLDALYYCFISLTTIGLGDYTPGDNEGQPFRALYKICTTCYLLIGLTFMMLLLHLFNDIPQLNLGQFLLRKADNRNDPERMHLNESSEALTPNYSLESDLPTLTTSKN